MRILGGCVAGAVLVAVFAQAQELDQNVSGGVDLAGSEVRFRQPFITSLDIPLPDGLTRRVAIYRGAEREDSEDIVYFHAPIFAFATSPEGRHGHELIHDLREVGDQRRVRFRLLSSDAGLRADAMRRAAYEADRGWLHARGFEYDQVRIRSVPLTRVIMRLSSRDDDDPGWPVTQSPYLGSFGEEFNLTVQFEASEFADFMAALEAGDVMFGLSWAATATVQQTAGVTRSMLTAAQQHLSQALTHNRIQPEAPVFQSVRASFEEDVQQSFQGAAFASSVEAAQLFPSIDFVSHVFEQPPPIDLSDVTALDAELLRQIFNHLQPVLERHDIRTGSTETITETDEQLSEITDRTRRVQNLKADIGLEVGQENERVHEIRQTDLDRIVSEQGVTFAADVSTGYLRPATIEVSFLADGWQRSFQSAAARVVVNAEAFGDYFVDSPISQDFTLEHLHLAVGQWTAEAGAPYPHLPVGAAMCYFGKNTPEGFVWADGQSHFPDQDWVASSLRGRPVPNMNQDGLLIGATADPGHIGDLRLPEPTILPELVVERGMLAPKNTVSPHRVRFDRIIQLQEFSYGGGNNFLTAGPSGSEIDAFVSLGISQIPPDRNNSFASTASGITYQVDWRRTAHERCRNAANPSVACRVGRATARFRQMNLSNDVPISVTEHISGTLPLGEVTPERRNAPEHVACRWIIRLR